MKRLAVFSCIVLCWVLPIAAQPSQALATTSTEGAKSEQGEISELKTSPDTVSELHLKPNYATSILMPEPIASVVLGSLILAGWSLRQEASGASFEVGGGFLKYVLWAGIFLTLPGIFAWLNANGVSIQSETTGQPSGYMQQIETVIENFVTDVVLNHLVPVLAATLVLKGVLDVSEGHAPVGSIIASLFLLGVYGVYNHARQQWNDVSAYATTNFLMSAWTYVATSICPIAAGLAIATAILAYVRNQQWIRYVGCALALLSVTGLYALVKSMTGVTT